MQQENKKIKKPNRELVEQFKEFGTATISSALREVCGIRRAFMIGPVAFTSGKKAVGTAVTLQFLPKREDIEPGQTEEEQESTSALWSATIEVGNGDILVVDKSLKPRNFSTVIANIHDELVVKSFVKEGNKQFLTSGSKNFEDRILINEEDDIFIWGVVTYVIHSVY